MFFLRNSKPLGSAQFSARIFSFCGVLIILRALPFFCAITLADDTTQSNAQKQAEILNKQASDQSMQGATTSAMKALMHLADAQYSQAFANGYKSYGQYTNSTDLDDMANQNKALKTNLTSSGGKSIQSGAVTHTSFRRLNPNFLNQGEAGKVAAEFEKKSGMKRTDFLNVLSAVSEQDVFSDDPNIIAKSFSKFDQFIKAIPNKSFRENLLHNVNKIPESIRTGALLKAITNLTPSWAINLYKKDSTPPVVASAVATPGKQPETPSPTPADTTSIPTSNLAAEPKKEETKSRELAANVTPEDLEKRMMGLKYDHVDPFLTGLIETTNESSLDEAKEKSLFSQVSAHYRAMESRFH